MAIAMVVEIPGLTQEQYEAAVQHINQAGPRVGGALVHAAGSMEGGCRVMEVWESQAAADAFYSSALFRQITADFAEPKITAWPLYALDGSGLK
jgi:quinol monooxygenase YgiN